MDTNAQKYNSFDKYKFKLLINFVFNNQGQNKKKYWKKGRTILSIWSVVMAKKKGEKGTMYCKFYW